MAIKAAEFVVLEVLCFSCPYCKTENEHWESGDESGDITHCTDCDKTVRLYEA